MSTFQFFLDCKRERGTVIPPHFHDFYELVCYFGGKGYSDYRSADRMPYKPGEFLTPYDRKFSTDTSLRFGENTIVLYHPYTIHNEVHEKDCEILAVGFTLSRQIPDETVILHSPPQKLLDILAKMRKEYNEKKKQNYELMLDGLTDVLLSELFRFGTDSRPVATPPLHYVKIYIDNYYMTDLSVKNLADMTGFSPDHFCRLFIREYGVAPKEYLLRRRLAEAEKLLSDTDLSISDIASRTGFADVSSFSRFYAKRLGRSPSHNRKK